VTKEDPPFGQRFIDAYRRLGGSLSAFTYAEVQELKACDREALIHAVRRAQPMATYAALQRIRTAESPEQLAREVLLEQRLQANASNWGIFVLLAALH